MERKQFVRSDTFSVPHRLKYRLASDSPVPPDPPVTPSESRGSGEVQAVNVTQLRHLPGGFPPLAAPLLHSAAYMEIK